MTSTSPTVVALGELLWDVFPDGARFGGAPGNFAHHAASLGADVWMVSGVGDDELGASALEHLRASGLHVDHVIVSDSLPTGAVQVQLDQAGHASYHFNDCDAWDKIPWSDELGELARRAEAVCFGTLGQRNEVSRQTIQSFLASTSSSTWRVLDLNLRPPYYDAEVIDQSLQLANVLKLNDDELGFLARLYELDAEGERDRAAELVERFQLELVALTRGDRGGMLVRQGEVSEVESRPVDIRDTVGAGDSFTAAVVIGLIHGIDLDTINQTACRVAEFVCTQGGATPRLPKELRLALGTVP